MGSDDFTVTHALSLMDDHIFTIEEINTNGVNSQYIPAPQTQEAVNEVMDRYVKSLQEILIWNGLDAEGNDLPPNTQPDVVSYMDNGGDDSTYQTAIALGQAYIAENS